MRHYLPHLLFILLSLIVAAPAACVAENKGDALVSFETRDLKLTHSYAVWNPAFRQLTVGYFLTPLSAEEIAEVKRRKNFANALMDRSEPFFQIVLLVRHEAEGLYPAALIGYSVQFLNFGAEAPPETLNAADPTMIGVKSLSGSVMSGSVVEGEIEYKTVASHRMLGWKLQLHATVL